MAFLAQSFTAMDAIAFGIFLFFWLCFEVVIDHSPVRYRSLSGLITHQRREWMLEMADREVRIGDIAIVTGQMHGATFFSSASILATGGCFALLGATDAVVAVFRDLALSEAIQRSVWEMKVLGLAAVFVYAFFKFAWSFRLFSYCAVLMGAIRQPEDDNAEMRRKQALRAAEMNTLAARHFTAGVRAILFSGAYLGWLLGPGTLIFTTCAVMAVLIRRQFFSNARRVLAG